MQEEPNVRLVCPQCGCAVELKAAYVLRQYIVACPICHGVMAKAEPAAPVQSGGEKLVDHSKVETR